MSGIGLNGTALIIGAAGGIGKETAFSFAEAGAEAIIFADLDLKAAETAAEESKKFRSNDKYRALALKVDVTSPESVQSMVGEAVRGFGRIDYNINCFGVDNNYYSPISESSVEDYDNVMNVNARGVMLCVRAVSKMMLAQPVQTVRGRSGTREIGRGSIVNIGSGNSYAPLKGKTAYVTSKHAALGISKVAALEMVSQGVRVNSVCPTWVKTPLLDKEIQKNPEVAHMIQAATPMGRAATPEEVAEVVLFLCSSGASYVTGTGLLVDSGMTLLSSRF